jgi:hypothetical protein
MATAFHVQGPTLFETDAAARDGTTFVGLGYSPNEQLVGWNVEHGSVRLTSSRGGDAPLEVIYTGSVGTLDVVLEEWDVSEFKQVTEPPDATTYGKIGTIGQVWVGGNWTFACRIQPVTRAGADATETSSKPQVTFPVCFLDGPDSFRVFDMGNESSKIGLSITVIADTTDVLFSTVES